MVLSHGTLSAPAEHADRLRQLLRQLATQTRSEPGCLAYSVSEDLERPGHFIISERWASLADMQTHLALPGVGQAVQAAQQLGVSDLSITAWETGTETRIM